MKISFFNSKLLKSTFNVILLEGSLLGIFAIFYNDFISKYKIWFIILFILVFVIYHIAKFIYYKRLRSINLKIRNSNFNISFGDIFKQDGLKVISFNEYFDTIVDDKIIAKSSLNGQFIINKVENVKKLDLIIKESLNNSSISLNKKRLKGKKEKYELGSIVEYDDYLLTALTKFDEDNRASLSLKEYLLFLMNFWDNLDKVYANRSVFITLFGSSSLTRFKDTNDITDQDLIEIILWSFKVSKIKFKYPTTISLILSDNMINKINLFELKERYKNVI